MIEKLLNVAKEEIGYLEKASANSLYDKKANAGKGNYTKYWADVKPSYQGQPWCACFVSWCFYKTFGKQAAALLLRHFPFVYCPQIASLFALYTKPQKGDIALFIKNNEYVHTGIVESVNHPNFTTIEGNTSQSDGVVSNGGGVHRKTYSLQNMSAVKFIRPEYEYVERSTPMTSEERRTFDTLVEVVNKLAGDVQELKFPMVYNYIDDNMPEWARPTIQKLVDKGFLNGNENGELGLDDVMLKIFVVNDRAGLYD